MVGILFRALRLCEREGIATRLLNKAVLIYKVIYKVIYALGLHGEEPMEIYMVGEDAFL